MEMEKINFYLFKACCNNDFEEIRSVANLGANINYGLMGACYSGHEDLVVTLISCGATDLRGCLRYSKNLKIARLLINNISSIDIINFLKEIFKYEDSHYNPFRGMMYELRIDNLPMREDFENLKYIIKNCEVVRILKIANESNLKKLFQLSVECLDSSKLRIEDTQWLFNNDVLENYIYNFQKTNKSVEFIQYLVLSQHISYKRLHRISTILPEIPRFYYKFKKITNKKKFKKKEKKLYNLAINKDPVYILLLGSYDKNNKILSSLPIKIFKILNTYI